MTQPPSGSTPRPDDDGPNQGPPSYPQYSEYGPPSGSSYGPPQSGSPYGPPPGGPGQYGPPPQQQPFAGAGDQFGQLRDPGFFPSLFDISFSKFVTPRVLGILYVLLMVAIVIFYIVVVIAGFSEGVGQGLLALVLGAVGALIYLILARVLLEFYAATIRTAQNTSKLVEQAR